MGTDFMIIELGNYNSAKIFIGTRPRSQVPVMLLEWGPEVLVLGRCHMEVEGRGIE